MLKPNCDVHCVLTTSPHASLRACDTHVLGHQWITVRFQLEVAIYLAWLLGRRLLVPGRLRMRDCNDISKCAASRCVQYMDDDWWCPTSLFLNGEALDADAKFTSNKDEETHDDSKTDTHHIKQAFDSMYKDDAVWVERLPFQIRQRLTVDNIFPASASIRPNYQVEIIVCLCLCDALPCVGPYFQKAVAVVWHAHAFFNASPWRRFCSGLIWAAS